jgi:iron complex outermembrane receptor protein
MKAWVILMTSASAAATTATPAMAQTAAAGLADQQPGAQPAVPPSGDLATPSDQTSPSAAPDIVVRGIRTSLAKAAQIKRDADQVVDSIVAEDIGKFPDPTVASALQRVPGVQVSVNGNNEIANPIIRGLGDILTTVNGREIFTGTGRGFAFQDLPAEALAGADVYKSNSANLIEGGVAGVIDLKLHRAFDFKKFTISGTVRGTYAPKADAVNPTVGLLVADRFDTGIGEIGVLADVSYSYNKFSRQTPFNDNLRGTLIPGVSGADGVVIPTAENLLNSNGEYQRPQANFSVQWKAAPGLEVYTEGLYAGYRSRYANNYSLYDINSAQSLSNVVTNDDCNTYQLGANGFYDPNGTTHRLCTVKSFTANNTFANSQAEANHSTTDLYLIAGGVKYDGGRFHANLDVSWQKSTTRNETFTVVAGKPIAAVSAQTDVRGGANITVPGSPLADPNDFRFAFGLNENYNVGKGQMFAAKLDTTLDVGGLLENIQAGARFASRDSTYQAAYLGAVSPGGDYATPLSSIGLPTDFLQKVSAPDRVNGGASFLAPSTDYLLSPGVQNLLRSTFGLPTGVPGYQPERGFDAQEKTYAGYVQGKYEIPVSGPISIDGLVGVRLTRTDRDIQGSGVVIGANGVSTVTPVLRSTSDTDWLPNASARLRFGGGFQARATYSKSITRPDFGSLNPGLNYTISTNQYILNSGSSGNPDLKPEEADSFDGTLEYYFSKNDYVSIGVYYKKITNRITQTVAQEAIGGINYNISRPRNIGSADLKGLEVSGQAFLDFLPGALSGLGTFGNFTIADSKVTTPGDNLYGLELTGVSKYSFNAGLLYEKYGFSGRVVYTYRSNYIGYDVTQSQDVRPVDDLVYLNENRGYGRLDFGLNYDITKAITISLNGTNVLAGKTKSYRAFNGNVLLPRDLSYDDSSYSAGIRFLF